MPIDVRVTGVYHDLGEFVADLASMPRVVTLGDVAIGPTRMDASSCRPGGHLPLPRRGRARATRKTAQAAEAEEQMMNRAALIGACVLLAGCAGAAGRPQRPGWTSRPRPCAAPCGPCPNCARSRSSPMPERRGDDPFRRCAHGARAAGLGERARPDLDRRREAAQGLPARIAADGGRADAGNNTHALVKAGTVLHQVKAGNYMGQNFGVITLVTENEIKLRELVEDVYGDWG